MSRRLVIWDVDGTLVDSAGEIAVIMSRAFSDDGLDAPALAAVRGTIGLTLPVAFERLHPGLGEKRLAHLTHLYRHHSRRHRDESGLGGSPLFPGIRTTLESLAQGGETHLAVATGKSFQSLMPILDGHGLTEMFASIQVSDDHPSKPHPSMVFAAMAETGAAPARTVMVGDTSFDMDMARAAGVAALAVSWGYHPAETLSADAVAHDAGELPTLISRLAGDWP